MTAAGSPCTALPGLTESSTGVAALIRNELAPVATSPSVVRVTVLKPAVESAAIVTFTTAWVVSTTVTLFTETPGPKFAVVTFCWKLVFVPVTVTLSSVCACTP